MWSEDTALAARTGKIVRFFHNFRKVRNTVGMWKKTYEKGRNFFREFSACHATTIAGAWVFFLLLAVVPIFFLLVTAFGVFGVDVSIELASRIPEEFRGLVLEIIDVASQASRGATVLFVLTVFWSGSSLFSHMLKDGELLYGAKRGKSGVVRKLLSFLLLFLLLTVFFLSAFLLFLNRFIVRYFVLTGFWAVLVKVALYVVAFSVIYVIVFLLQTFISPVRVTFANRATGAAVSLGITLVGTLAFLVYIRYFHSYNVLYGSLAALIVFLLWSYIITLSLVTGAIVVKRRTQRRAEEIPSARSREKGRFFQSDKG